MKFDLTYTKADIIKDEKERFDETVVNIKKYIESESKIDDASRIPSKPETIFDKAKNLDRTITIDDGDEEEEGEVQETKYTFPETLGGLRMFLESLNLPTDTRIENLFEVNIFVSGAATSNPSIEIK